MDDDSFLVKCAMCNEMISLKGVNSHAFSCRPAIFATPSRSALTVSYPSDFEEQMRSIYSSPQGVMMESLEEPPTVELGPADSVYRLSLPDGRMAGWVAKRGADFHLYDCTEKRPQLLKSIRGRLMEQSEAVVSDLGEAAKDASSLNKQDDSELTLLCKVCEGQVPVALVEKHAKTCAISFPVQIIRFEHSDNSEEARRKKDKAVPEIARLEDFPLSVINALDKSGVPREMYAKHLDVLVNVLNFASKMRFRVAENRATPLRDAAIVALRSTNSDTVAELAKVALHNAGSREAQLAKNALHVLNEAMALLDASKGADDVVASAKRAAATMPSESQRILAAQKEVFLAAAQCYDELDERAAKRLYALESKIGEGGYGKVYAAKQKDKKAQPTLVAIKVMQHLANDAKGRRTNLRELLYLSRLRHPNIVHLHRAHLVGGSALWLVIEYMEGGTLREAAKIHLFDEGEVAFSAFEILKAVAFIHEHGCVHRDIKSHNVMMTVRGEIKLIDFGLVADVKKGISTMRGILGTTYWIPPEMIRGEPHSYPADIWSTGVCLMELCHGYPPNRDNKLRALFLTGAGVAPALEDPSRWSMDCREFFARTLVPDADERATAAELLVQPFLNRRCTEERMAQRMKEIFLNTALSSAGF